jgi:hypothetical protein
MARYGMVVQQPGASALSCSPTMAFGYLLYLCSATMCSQCLLSCLAPLPPHWLSTSTDRGHTGRAAGKAAPLLPLTTTLHAPADAAAASAPHSPAAAGSSPDAPPPAKRRRLAAPADCDGSKQEPPLLQPAAPDPLAAAAPAPEPASGDAAVPQSDLGALWSEADLDLEPGADLNGCVDMPMRLQQASQAFICIWQLKRCWLPSMPCE